MRVTTFLSLASAFIVSNVQAQNTTEPITGTLGNATTTDDNPAGTTYVAVLPDTEFFNEDNPQGNVKGSISATAGPDGVGVSYTVNFSNLPTSGGPFLYHIHVAPVPTSGNCTATLAHLDPFIRGETPPCDATLPETCQVGDLSGKYGKITSDPFSTTFIDPYTTTVEGVGSFFGNRSFVVHYANKTRITCANFYEVSSASPSSTGTGSGGVGGNGTAISTATSAPSAIYTGSAAAVTASLSVVFAGAIMSLLM